MVASSISLNRALFKYLGVPLVGIILVFGGISVMLRLACYESEQQAVHVRVNRLSDTSSQGKSLVGPKELDAVKAEQLASLRHQLIQDIALFTSLTLVSIAGVLYGMHLTNARVCKNLTLLNDRLSLRGKESSALMGQHFDFSEFGPLVETIRENARIRNEAEQRWKLAEQELVSANQDLLKHSLELKAGRKAALGMIEDAKKTRKELEATNARLEEAIEHAKQSAHEAELANVAKSEFLATMSHEIRTPLNGVIGFIDMMKMTSLDEEQLDYVDTIKECGNNLMSLVNDILDFSKIESGRIDLEQREFHLVRMLRELSSRFFTEASKKGLSLHIDIAENVPREVIGDETRLKQIITNLLANAIKFTETGKIELFVSLLPRPIKPGLHLIEFEIRDTGIGISAEQMANLFMPFSQADSSTTRKFGGTGLGLAICKRLCEAMGGQITVDSKAGEGSSFFARVQLVTADSEFNMINSEENQTTENSDKDPSQYGKLRIAVAEDNLANQQVLRMMLRRLGCEATFKNNGLELVEYLKGNPVDLVLMDLQMPVMDGLKATTVIRSGEAGESLKDVQVVAVTANAMKTDRENCQRVGMNGFLSKPIKLDLLEDVIANTVKVIA